MSKLCGLLRSYAAFAILKAFGFRRFAYANLYILMLSCGGNTYAFSCKQESICISPLILDKIKSLLLIIKLYILKLFGVGLAAVVYYDSC